MLIHLPSLALDVGGLIYMVIVVIWILARIKSAKKSDDPATEDRPAQMPPLNDDIRDLLETLTGQRLERPQAPPPIVVRETASGEVAVPPPIPQRRSSGRPQNPRQNRLERKLAEARARAEAHRQAVEAADAKPVVTPVPPPVLEVEHSGPAEVTATVHSPGARMSMRTITTRITPIKLPTIRMGLSSGMMRESAHPLLESTELHERATLRRTIISQMVLGPPKALEQSTERF